MLPYLWSMHDSSYPGLICLSIKRPPQPKATKRPRATRYARPFLVAVRPNLVRIPLIAILNL
jgi:hypothetical protein